MTGGTPQRTNGSTQGALTNTADLDCPTSTPDCPTSTPVTLHGSSSPAQRRLRSLRRHLTASSPLPRPPPPSPSASPPHPPPSSCPPARPPPPLTVLITGCTSGIGRALAFEFARVGHTVIGCGRRTARLAELEAALPPPHAFHVCDVTSEPAVAGLAHALRGRTIDVVVSNAGVVGAGRPSFPWDTAPGDFSSVIDTNLKGTFYVGRHFGKVLVEQSRVPGAPLKRLINISSGLGHSTNPKACAYSASKWGVESLSKSFAQALRAAGVGNMICVPFAPGTLTTEMNKKGSPLEGWAPLAAAFILQLGVGESGSSVAMPGYYAEDYMATWVIPAGLAIPGSVVAPQ